MILYTAESVTILFLAAWAMIFYKVMRAEMPLWATRAAMLYEAIRAGISFGGARVVICYMEAPTLTI